MGGGQDLVLPPEHAICSTECNQTSVPIPGLGFLSAGNIHSPCLHQSCPWLAASLGWGDITAATTWVASPGHISPHLESFHLRVTRMEGRPGRAENHMDFSAPLHLTTASARRAHLPHGTLCTPLVCMHAFSIRLGALVYR